MLQSAAGVVFHAAPVARDSTVHQLSLRFEKSQVRSHRQDAPWKVVRAFPQENGALLVHLHNISGGVLAGDRLALEIEVEPGAAAQVTTTGATRLYRHRLGSVDSEQRTSISIGEGAVLEYLPDAVIPYSGARHTQSTMVRLDRRSTVFWWEILAPGRQAAGEIFAFERLEIENRIASLNRPILWESFKLDPANRPLSAKARMGHFTWAASFYICQEGQEPQFWRGLEGDLNEEARQRTGDGEVIWGASTLVRDGVVVKGLSTNSRLIHSTLINFWQLARRKITGVEAIVPRKTY